MADNGLQDRALTTLRNLFRSPGRPHSHGLLLSGGGARAAYQAGVLSYIGETFPEAAFPLLTGVSAGAINTAHLAHAEGSFLDSANHLIECWNEISQDRVFESTSSISWLRGYLKSRSSNALSGLEHTRGMVQTDPLREFLVDKLKPTEGRIDGIQNNIERGRLEAVAIVTTNYGTGQTVTWIQGSEIEGWERAIRVGVRAQLSVDHVMASTALPIIFPAVQIGDAWYGDGGIRFSAPLAPLVHLGADRILAISTRYNRSRSEADVPTITGYPTTTRIFGLLLNAVFLDALDQDALAMQRINALVEQLPPRKRLGLRPVDLLVLRPSVDLGMLAGEYETRISGVLGLMTRALGTGSSKSPDWLSMLLFDQEYIQRLIELGRDDARNQHDTIEGFLD